MRANFSYNHQEVLHLFAIVSAAGCFLYFSCKQLEFKHILNVTKTVSSVSVLSPVLLIDKTDGAAIIQSLNNEHMTGRTDFVPLADLSRKKLFSAAL